MKRGLLLLAGLLWMGSLGLGSAQETVKKHKKPNVSKHLKSQNQHIADEVKEGNLTGQQAGKLDREGQYLKNEIKNDKAANGGKLTKAEKKRINHLENVRANQMGKDVVKNGGSVTLHETTNNGIHKTIEESSSGTTVIMRKDGKTETIGHSNGGSAPGGADQP
jgi:hypothetical protein